MPDLTDIPCKWMEGAGPYADIVLASRIRLARNLLGIPFTTVMGKADAEQVLDQVAMASSQPNVERVVGRLEVTRLDRLPRLKRQVLVEKHLISPQHAEPDGLKAVVLNQEESVSIMVNEEDHLRIQCLLPAFQLQDTWNLTTLLDDVLEEKLDYAFDKGIGYLTTCPTNVGTGLRASVMVHLPGLVMSKQAQRVLSALSHVGLTVRGIYGEGSEAAGNLFQISNQITLGHSEEEIIDNLVSVTRQIIDGEKTSREMLLREIRPYLEDRVGRALGILSHASLISSDEAIRLLSDVRLGIDLNLLTGLSLSLITELMVGIQPAYLQLQAGRELGPQERDQERASFIRRRLASGQANFEK